MKPIAATIIRAFDGSLADAEGLLAVERASFDESPYSAGQVRAMLTEGPQRAWLALGAGQVVGFVIAFPTHGLAGASWEIDLLAVLAEWTGRGLATRLIRAAGDGGKAVARRARAVVATDNEASARAFQRAGFRPAETTCELLILRPEGLAARSRQVAGLAVHETHDPAQARAWLPDPPRTGNHPDLTLLLAEQEGRPAGVRQAGYAELLDVQTLLYRGWWIESLAARTAAARRALVSAIVDRAIGAGLDEVGMLVPAHDWPTQKTLLEDGFRSLGAFRWLTADLPLPGQASGGHD